MDRQRGTICGAVVLAVAAWSSAGAEESRYERYAAELKKLDRNQNGLLEPGEISSDSRRLIEKVAERAGVDRNQPLPLERLLSTLADVAARERSGSSTSSAPSNSGSPSSGNAPTASAGSASSASGGSASRTLTGPGGQPLVPGFGEKAGGVKVPGFGEPLFTAANRPIEEVFDPRVVERARRALREYDRNNDGILDADELRRADWSNPPISESDMDKDGKLTTYELAERYRKRYEWNGPPEPPKNGSTAGSSSGSSSGGGSSSRGDGGRGSSGDSSRLRSYAESLLKQYDTNKNGLLEKDEWKEMKSEYHKADQNGDNVLTIEELMHKLTAMSGGDGGSSGGGNNHSGSGSSSGSSSRSGGSGPSPATGGISKSSLASAKKAGRFLTPTERLPKGLPDWFIRNDADGDGQIMMAEYAAAWSESTAAEFMKYDLDLDGFITPEECLEALKKK